MPWYTHVPVNLHAGGFARDDAGWGDGSVISPYSQLHRALGEGADGAGGQPA